MNKGFNLDDSNSYHYCYQTCNTDKKTLLMLLIVLMNKSFILLFINNEDNKHLNKEDLLILYGETVIAYIKLHFNDTAYTLCRNTQ